MFLIISFGRKGLKEKATLPLSPQLHLFDHLYDCVLQWYEKQMSLLWALICPRRENLVFMFGKQETKILLWDYNRMNSQLLTIVYYWPSLKDQIQNTAKIMFLLEEKTLFIFHI